MEGISRGSTSRAEIDRLRRLAIDRWRSWLWCAMMGPMSRLGFVSATAVSFAAITLLSGCSGQLDGFVDLQGEKQDRDELPELADNAYDELDVSTSRYIGEHEGTSLWLAQGLENSTVCLVADAGEKEWLVGCGGGAVKVSGQAGTYQVVGDGAAAPEGAVKISENVYAW